MIAVNDEVTKENPTTPTLMMKDVKSFSDIDFGKISPYPTVVIVVMHQYKLVQYKSKLVYSW